MLARRLRTAAGEADLALRDGDALVVCEVKTARRAGAYRPGDRLDAAALARRARTARTLARDLGLSRSRVDLVEVVIARRARPRVVWHRGVREPLPRAARGPPERRRVRGFQAGGGPIQR